MNEQVRYYLIDLARKRTNQTVTYQKLSDICGLRLSMSSQEDRNKIAEILREISIFEYKNNRPLLSALVLRAGDHYEGDGFFKLAEQLGFGDWQKLKREATFDIEQIKACIDFWQNDSHFVAFR